MIKKLWKAYCDELILENPDKTGEDVRQALATFLREIAFECQYQNFNDGEDMIIDARDLYNIADELEMFDELQ